MTSTAPAPRETAAPTFHYSDCSAATRLTNVRDSSTNIPSVFAYTLDADANMTGYARDPTPLCYGWSDGGERLA